MSNAPTENRENRQVQAGVSAANAQTQDQLFAENKPTKAKRTLGLRLFDNLLYTVLTNTSVFLMSVGLTYMTKHGRTIGAEGSKTRAVGTWFAKRRDPILKGFEKIGVKGQAADDATTVLFSFVDGTLFAPLVKLVEDRREKIAYKIDSALGTTPDNMSAYDAEPKQSWRSVIEGRLATSAIVVPIAIAMEKTGGNNAIFYRAGNKLATFVKDSLPKLDQWLTKKTIHHKEYFFQTSVFETFYTSVCTVGLYIMSRGIARSHPPAPKKSAPAANNSFPASPVADEALSAQTQPIIERESTDTPSTSVAQRTHLSRIAPTMHAQELTT